MTKQRISLMFEKVIHSLKSILFLMSILLLLNGCAVVHHYDEITGKVVELETGKPIEGAAVHASYYTLAYNFIVDPTDWYLNSQETKTDANGEFVIPSQLSFAFRPLNLFDDWVPVMIYKPGYGCYGRGGEKRGQDIKGKLEPGMNAVVGLPKLLSRSDRIKGVSCYPPEDDAVDDYKYLFELIQSERVNLGLQPRPYPE